ncbi:hypothetical protein HF325_006893 [Metschnikowia pulcherrima]|uniref:Uncharacterized protein n=1 Tax=Metschnikowia pulcherrima TaxID=27326 RepID=A0A8H7L871_9ASCO|nr:hypothetical protein HF325_006893 [Metschnikowia pulcherrima]
MNPVSIYKYYKNLTAIEFSDSANTPENFVVFIGGLTDGFLTVPYVPLLAKEICGQLHGRWALVQALISSSYLGFGTGSLSRDAEELSKLVAYLRKQRGSDSSKIVLMGHSTGCQDTMEYLTGTHEFEHISRLDGAILQAPISDVEACEYLDTEKQLPGLLAIAEKLIGEGKSEELLPVSSFDLTFGAPTTAYQTAMMIFFCLTLNDSVLEKTFGKVKVPLLALQGSKDGAVPPYVDMATLMNRWRKFAERWSSLSCIVLGADHNLSEDSDAGAVDILIEKVISFIKKEFQ